MSRADVEATARRCHRPPPGGCGPNTGEEPQDIVVLAGEEGFEPSIS